MSPGKTDSRHVLALSVISAIGCSISILFLFMTVAVHCLVWRYVKSDNTVILINLCFAFMLSYILFLSGVTRTENKDICTTMAVLLHYIFLVDFSFMLAEGIQIGFSVLYVFPTKSRIRWLVPLCWIMPAIIVGICMWLTEMEGYGNYSFCWLSVDSGLVWGFIGPALFVILVNMIILIFVVKTLLNTHGLASKTMKERTKASLRSILVVLPLFGLTWILGVFSVNEDLVVFQYLFAICNSFQGVFIFLLHTYFNKKVKKGIQHLQRKSRSDMWYSAEKHKAGVKQGNENIFVELDNTKSGNYVNTEDHTADCISDQSETNCSDQYVEVVHRSHLLMGDDGRRQRPHTFHCEGQSQQFDTFNPRNLPDKSRYSEQLYYNDHDNPYRRYPCI